MDSINSAEAIIKEVRKKYYDAKHHCFAYIINEENQVKRFSDDGEPTGTAGSPILNVIEKNGFMRCINSSYKVFWRESY